MTNVNLFYPISCLFKTLGKVQMGYVLGELIHNNDEIKILRFAEQIHNPGGL